MEEQEEHRRLQDEAVRIEGDAFRDLLAGQADAGRTRLREAVRAYRRSWEEAPPRSYGRLVGMLKAAAIAGDADDEAAYVRAQIGESADSPPSWYALAIAALLGDDDELARRAAAGMREGSDAFGRAADAVEAIADGDRSRYAAAIDAIVADFERREDHLTGVPIADTALLLEVLAERRGLAAYPRSAVLPDER
jgi:hypothetical protein